MNRSTPNAYSQSDDTKFGFEKNLEVSTGTDMEIGDAVIAADADINGDLFSDCYYVLMVNNTTNEVYAAKNVHKRMYPASMTKLMTATIVAEKIEAGEISLDDTVTVQNYYDLSGEGGGINPLGVGSQIKLKDLLCGLLIQSNNYYALVLADYVAGSQEAFCNLMNEKAYSIGATNTHFANPHGLDDVNHYTTAYDIYLILKEASTHQVIQEIDEYSEYTYTYTNSAGNPVEATITCTNLFKSDSAQLPGNYEIKTWKTGTTDGAGYCLAMLLSDGDNSYIVIASDGESKPQLYDSIVKLVCLIDK